MDGFTYNNIFETKGIEYLAIIAFFLVLIPFWIMLNQSKVRTQFQKASGFLNAGVFRVPRGLFFSRNHTWAHMESSGLAKVGVDDLLMHVTGVVNFSNLRQPGERISKGDLIAEIDNNGKRLKVFSPVSGEIMQNNPVLTEFPQLLNEDPYQKGWMYKIKPSGWKSETSPYYLADEAVDWAAKEYTRFKDFLAESIARYSPDSQVVFQDGGELVDHTLTNLPEEIWEDFQKNFLN